MMQDTFDERNAVPSLPTSIRHVLKACTQPVVVNISTQEKANVARCGVGHMREAFKAGNIIDLGLIPTGVIQQQAKAYHKLVHAGAIQDPFGASPYILTHTWMPEVVGLLGGIQRSTFVVTPLSDDTTKYFLTELLVSGSGRFVVTNSVVVCSVAGEETYDFFGGASAVYPDSPDAARFHCVCAAETVSAVLTILNTKGVASTVKSGKARRGKVLIPSHHKVDTRDYVTAITRKRSGSHKTTVPSGRAPVIPHLRRGHWALIPETYEPHGRHRQCPDDPNRIEVWRSEALVNCASESELSFASRQRTSYKLERV